MNVETMRSEIAKVYTGDGWKKKVKNMPENQVVAVYLNFKKTGMFDIQRKLENENIGKQLTFDDILRGGKL